MPLEEGETFFFAPRALKNLVLVDELPSFAPIITSQVADLAHSKKYKTRVTKRS